MHLITYRPPQNRHSNQENCTKKVLFFTSFFHTGWHFFGLHPEKLAKVNVRAINIIQDECNHENVRIILTDHIFREMNMVKINLIAPLKLGVQKRLGQ